MSPTRVQSYRDGEQDGADFYHFRYGGVSLRADAEFGGLTVMSLTAVRRMHADYAVDLDRGPLPLLTSDPRARQEQFSQEIQLQSTEPAPFHWVAGLYFLDIEERYKPTPFDYGGSYSAGLGGRLRQTIFSRGDATSYAAYGQATMPIHDATTLTLGLRYTIEDRSIAANAERLFDNAPFVRPIPGLPLLSQAPRRDSASFDELTWRVSLNHPFSDEVKGYLSANRGFQSGGWNLQTPQNPAFRPERLDDFEAGLKYVDRSRRFRADANIFYYDYSDLQVSAFTQVGSTTTNAASAEVYGLELQLGVRPDRDTDVTIGAQLLKTRFKAFPNASCTNFSAGAATPYAPISCVATGNDFPFAPEFKVNAGISRQIPLGRIGSLELSANLSYNSGYYAEPDNIVRQDGFATVDASVEWRPGGRGPSVRLWVLNLTDTHYYESLATVATVGAFQSPAAPRRVGVSVVTSF
ncbi:MAG: TonB-dependent receptor [Sphingomonadales bacterium]|nr:MAG: TonB-dependent receptor [Sphingomonadales bacterium]